MPRQGGSFGGKLGRTMQLIANIAIAAKLTQKPVRMSMDLNSNLEMMGKRFANVAKYKVGCDERGRLQVRWHMLLSCCDFTTFFFRVLLFILSRMLAGR